MTARVTARVTVSRRTVHAMSENTPQHGAGKTGGLPGANADPVTEELPDDQTAELQAGDVSTQEPASEPPHDGA